MSSVYKYEVLGPAGSGAFGICQKIRRISDGKILACKVVSFSDMSKHQQNRLLQEVALLKQLNHPNIVQYYDHFVDKNKKEVYIVMEYCEGGDLSRLIQRAIKKGTSVKEEFILQVLVQLASALKHCHRRPDGSVVLHQDLKPENVFLHQNLTFKLGDFGLAQILPTKFDFAHSKVGTRLYMSPEKTNGDVYNEKSDIWSLGCLIYYLCALKHPFTAGGAKNCQTASTVGSSKESRPTIRTSWTL